MRLTQVKNKKYHPLKSLQIKNFRSITFNAVYESDIVAKNSKNLSSIASDVSDDVYNLTPKVQNELVVREKVSTMAVAASHSLIFRILNNASDKNLGMEGYPAEYGMYLSISFLKVTSNNKPSIPMINIVIQITSY